MSISELHNNLYQAYSPENLNRIARKLIVLYKNKNYSKIRTIANKISKYVSINDENDAKCFSRLMMIYHPDKGSSVINEMQLLYEQNNFESLQKYAHIFLLNDIETIQVETIDESIEYDPGFVWETNFDDGYTFTNEYGDEEISDGDNDFNYEKSFINLVKIREYGQTNIEIPSYNFEDIDEYEMEGSGLETLDGISYCIHLKTLDVSNNLITDISDLWDLAQLEELYAANNQIGYIDALCNLTNLRIVDLSGNQIDDISPLFMLKKLKFVNLVGNKVPYSQVKQLESMGCMVCTSLK
ncbi:MAG: leucine-rich repeat domain-containing protein [Prolixibacteraceae bacterium]|nr:leucine-rich repeat domain-containing protein [Prolixibacteraceae bacterium]